MILLIGGMGFIGLNTALRLLEVGEEEMPLPMDSPTAVG